MRMIHTLCVAACAAMPAAAAADVALIIGNEDYANGRDIADADEMLDAGPALEDAGYRVITVEDGSATDLGAALEELSDAADGTGHIVIAVAGHVVRSDGQAWLLGVDADTPGLGTVGAQGVNLSLLLEIAARAPGKAAVLIGTEERDIDLGDRLSRGVPRLDVPQGVTVITGPADDVADFAKDEVPRAGASLATSLESWSDLVGQGFLAPLVPFTTDGDAATAADPEAAQRAFWQATEAVGTVAAYEAYLERYDDGIFAAEARTQIEEINAQPTRAAEAREDALNLSRDARREIQRALSLLGYDPRGIDGIFGPGSRAAITDWQEANGQEATGFVTQVMRDRLALQADRRNAELEEEARQRQAELERKDRAYWEATGAEGDEAGLRSYLERYPDGVFAEIAQARLEPFEAARREEAQVQDRADWDAAVETDTAEAYRGYLQANPEGAFADQANTKLSELEFETRNAEALEAARRNEDRLGLNTSTKRVVEDRLAKAGLKPGEVDGEFDDATRRAIRRYQEARNLQKTGYLNQATVVRLLADAVLR
ncbi:peptidoglycan-binding domain-containing protein [Litoreibacter roseus]|uniref:Peptidoglycan-binding protein n=1 Tax=Litoreibacter roseus TaxID=2601869 RepID=A0A6N6JKF5_9RHOB|nr:peptidoglycan-binding protein [Litoreibacter roseus]GFE66340.1 peptidoglycan-binding protein [Litoreibacter roseus]